MITRSRARAERESTPTSKQAVGSVSEFKVGRREHIAPVDNECEDMGRRGGTSGRRTSNRLKPVDTSDVTPIQLFSMAEEVNREDEIVSRVSYHFLQTIKVEE